LLIALLIALGVDIAVIVAFGSLVIGRRRWLKRQPGSFAGAIRVVQGEVDAPAWKRGSGRWVRDVLVWSSAPFMYQNDLIPIDGITGRRRAEDGEIKRLGDEPTVVVFVSGDARIEVATSAKSESLATGPFTSTPGSEGSRG